MYRLVAKPFLDQNRPVVLVGYRTYPDADVNTQVSDLESALEFLRSTRPDLMMVKNKSENRDGVGGVVLVGHSTGAHIGLLMVLERARRRIERGGPSDTDEAVPVHAFVGMAGVYCINSHYLFESGRGIEELSPLKAACGQNGVGFAQVSVAHRLERIVNAAKAARRDESSSTKDEEAWWESILPRMLFLHGTDDTTVPYTSTVELVNELFRSVNAIDAMSTQMSVDQLQKSILLDVEHAETALHLMVGGQTRDVVMDWLPEGD